MKKQNKIETKYFLAVFLAVAILAVSGCVEQNAPSGELKITADELKTKVMGSSNEVKSYAFDGIMSVESQGMKFDVPMDGKVDTQNKKSYVATKIMGIDMEVYVSGNTAYTKSMGEWMKVTEKSGSEDQWEQSNQYESNLGLFKDAKVEITGEEDVKGEKCYSLKITPDTKKVIERMMQQSGEVSEEQLKMFGESVKEMIVKFWVSKKTYYIMKSEITMKLSVESQGQKMDMNMNMIIDMYDYNKPVEIQIPEEALNAEEYVPEAPPGMPSGMPPSLFGMVIGIPLRVTEKKCKITSKLSDQHIINSFSKYLKPDETEKYYVYGMYRPPLFSYCVMAVFISILFFLYPLFWKNYFMMLTNKRLLLMHVSWDYKEKEFQSIEFSKIEKVQVAKHLKSVKRWRINYTIKLDNKKRYYIQFENKVRELDMQEENLKKICDFFQRNIQNKN